MTALTLAGSPARAHAARSSQGEAGGEGVQGAGGQGVGGRAQKMYSVALARMQLPRRALLRMLAFESLSRMEPRTFSSVLRKFMPGRARAIGLSTFLAECFCGQHGWLAGSSSHAPRWCSERWLESSDGGSSALVPSLSDDLRSDGSAGSPSRFFWESSDGRRSM